MPRSVDVAASRGEWNFALTTIPENINPVTAGDAADHDMGHACFDDHHVSFSPGLQSFSRCFNSIFY